MHWPAERTRPGFDEWLGLGAILCVVQACHPSTAASDAGRPAAGGADAGSADAGSSPNPLLGEPYEAAPAGATSVDSGVFLTLLSQGKIISTGPNAVSAQVQASAADDTSNQSYLDSFVAMNRDAGDLIRGVEAGIATGVTGAQTLANGDVQITLFDATGNPSPRIIGSKSLGLSSLASSVRVFPALANQTNLYRALYAALSTDLRQRLSLPSPAQLSSYSVDQIAAYNLSMSDQWSYSAASAPQPSAPVPCDQEVGYNAQLPTASLAYGDQVPSLYGATECSGAPSTSGIFGSYDFPLKPYLSCVKNQGNRETCHTFGSISTVETLLARDYQQRVNLSEEDLVSHARLLWYPADYVETADPWSVLTSAADAGYRFALENQWDYNPSWKRTLVNNNTTFAHSCDQYPTTESCSDTSHQATLVCSTFGVNLTYCGYELPALAAPSPYSISPASMIQIWNLKNTSQSLHALLMNLQAYNPIVIAVVLTPAFEKIGSDGYLMFSAADAKQYIAPHIMEAVGLITNSVGSAMIPGFIPGSGGGYVIIKNSWSACFGDGGYIYLPFDYVQSNTTEAIVVGGLQMSP